MPKRISQDANAAQSPGAVPVAGWDFMTLLNTDIRKLEIARSLRKLGRIQVMDWDFRTVLPAVKRLANQEVDLISVVKRAAQYRILEWDFRSALPAGRNAEPRKPAGATGQRLSRAEMQATAGRLKDFLHYVVVNLIDEPKHAQIEVAEIGPNGLRFKLVLIRRDVAMLIGRKGQAASAIRGMLKSAAGRNGVWALLQIVSHEEEAALAANRQAPRR